MIPKLIAQTINGIDHTQFITIKELVGYIFASSGLLTLIFVILSRLFDKSSRVMIMEEIKKIDEQYQGKIRTIEGEVNKMRTNYLDRFSEQKDLINENKEIAQSNHNEVVNILVAIKKDIEYFKKNERN
ncbi:MAG: hypothetical protein B6D44_15220 [Ignavibacteriales bacterium UTCHB2]|nr:MAG: hypothetical protein B6D44_15220 [Ignavibacteriales bacterium UTCHB2]